MARSMRLVVAVREMEDWSRHTTVTALAGLQRYYFSTLVSLRFLVDYLYVRTWAFLSMRIACRLASNQ